MIDPELLAKLREVTDRVHIAMGAVDGYPDPFRDEVTLLLIQYESDLDRETVFRAVLHAAATSDLGALEALGR